MDHYSDPRKFLPTSDIILSNNLNIVDSQFSPMDTDRTSAVPSSVNHITVKKLFTETIN
jgi:hypothetical protein